MAQQVTQTTIDANITRFDEDGKLIKPDEHEQVTVDTGIEKFDDLQPVDPSQETKDDTKEILVVSELAWEQNRREALAQGGKIKCTFARVFLPSNSGVAPFFSIQRRNFADYIIEDCEVEELDQEATRKIFSVVAPCNEADYLNAKRWHVGKLSQDVLAYIRKYKGGQPTTPYVLYDPRDFVWQSAGAFNGTGMQTATKKRSLLPWILAAAGLLMN